MPGASCPLQYGARYDTQGELMLITQDYNIYQMPCGDFCASTCLDQAEAVPTVEVRALFVTYLFMSSK